MCAFHFFNQPLLREDLEFFILSLSLCLCLDNLRFRFIFPRNFNNSRRRYRERERERDGFHGSVVAWRASILVDNCFIIAVSGEGIITRVGPQLSNRNNGTKRVVIFFFLPESSQSQCLSVDNIMAAFYEDTFLSFRAIFPPIIDSLSR